MPFIRRLRSISELVRNRSALVGHFHCELGQPSASFRPSLRFHCKPDSLDCQHPVRFSHLSHPTFSCHTRSMNSLPTTRGGGGAWQVPCLGHARGTFKCIVSDSHKLELLAYNVMMLPDS